MQTTNKNSMNTWKFNERATSKLDDLKGAKVYKLRLKLDNGEKLSREEKNWIAENLNTNCYSRTGIPLMGWIFSFRDVVKLYWVKQYGQISERYAMDKTSIRATTYGKIDKIVEVA